MRGALLGRAVLAVLVGGPEEVVLRDGRVVSNTSLGMRPMSLLHGPGRMKNVLLVSYAARDFQGLHALGHQSGFGLSHTIPNFTPTTHPVMIGDDDARGRSGGGGYEGDAGPSMSSSSSSPKSLSTAKGASSSSSPKSASTARD